MDAQQFWSIIEGSGDQANGDNDAQCDALRDLPDLG